jgi:predicted ArsR family transcriptional regulator
MRTGSIRRAAARQFGTELARRCLASGPRGGTRQAIESALRGHGFEPWQDEDGTVRLRNCPFHQMAARHPGLVCGMNLALIEGLVAGLGSAGTAAALDPGPGRCCVVIGTGEPAGEARRTGTP